MQEEGRSLPATAAEPDALLPLYLDEVFFGGYNHSRGDRLLSAARLRLPDSGLTDPRRLEGVLAALKGFKRLARGHTRAPLAKQLVVAALGLALRWGLPSMAVGCAR